MLAEKKPTTSVIMLVPPAAKKQKSKTAETFSILPDKPTKTMMVRTALMFTPPYHGMRDPAKNENRLRTLRAHLKAAGGFSFQRCEVLNLSLRSDGRFAIMDGVGRNCMATVLTQPPIEKLESRVYQGLTLDEEIALYKAFLKERTKGRPLDEWLASRSVDTDVDTIMTTCERLGFQITGSRGTGKRTHTISLTVARLAYELDALDLTLARILNSTWKDSRLLTSEHLAAVAVLLGKLKADAGRLTAAMDAIPAGKIQVDALSLARDMEIKKPQGRHAAWLIAQLLIRQYNKGKMGGVEKLREADLIFECEFKDAYWPYAPKSRGD